MIIFRDWLSETWVNLAMGNFLPAYFHVFETEWSLIEVQFTPFVLRCDRQLAECSSKVVPSPNYLDDFL